MSAIDNALLDAKAKALDIFRVEIDSFVPEVLGYIRRRGPAGELSRTKRRSAPAGRRGLRDC